ncbi:ABC transporter permease [Pediococcus pentosaceus]|jgi:putative ABC transport system permease protein|uniref:ABC transporter permease n=1 Tax=Pediococcus pentosaceus TaxID=1255 RepID=UPI001963E1D9|nr:ABC transporter permease [Pediococcus pentosaceus]MBM9930222.1 ABC transporter permease [Pediococcus pentosaceus]
MNFIRRAWLSLIAKKGRSLLLVLVTAAIMLFVLAGILIHDAANTATKNAKANIGATLTLSANREAAFKNMQNNMNATTKPKLNMASVKLSDAKKIAQLNNVSNYSANVSTSVDADDFDAISTTGTTMSGGIPGNSSSTGDISINGVTSTSASSNFEDGTYKITKGRGITYKDVNTQNVVIESELAKQDSLKVGDTIKVKKTSGSKTTYKMKIVGVYKATSSSSTTQMGPGASDPANTIYTSYTFANTIKGSKYANTADSVTFEISAPSKINSVKKAGNKIINNSKFSLSANDTNYKMIKSSMENVKSFADKIVWLVAIAGTIILALIVILMIRERRHEIGILLSMGESRWKIVGQFFTELFVVLIVAIGIAGIGGNFVGDKLGQQLVTQQTSSLSSSSNAKTQPQNASGMNGGQPSADGAPVGGMTNNKSISNKKNKMNLDVNVTLMTMVELGGFGLVIMLLSTTIASAGVLRLEPKKVLIE